VDVTFIACSFISTIDRMDNRQVISLMRGCKSEPQQIPPRVEGTRIFPTKGLFG
jgi:hypothetical protein